MGQLSSDHKAQVSANKTSPPRLDPTLHLFRKRVVEGILSRRGTRKRLILIEAQAGQGKSTLAAQYLTHIDADFSWYQIAPDDRDPVTFIATLFAALMESLPDIRTSLLQKMIESSEVTAGEPVRFAEILLADLEHALRKDFHMVFDDVHLLEGSPHSLVFLNALVEGAPPRLRFVLLSRRPVLLDMAAKDALVLGNEELALTRKEIAELYASILEIPVSTETVQALHQATEGWIMGLVLAGHAFSGEATTKRLPLLLTAERGGILDYFRDEIFARLPADLRRTLLKLSLLESIPTLLAERLAEVSGVRDSLGHLLRQNLFLRCVDEVTSTFVFHHLFRDCLRTQAEEELSQAERRHAFCQAAAWYLEKERPEEALHYYLSAADYATAQTILRQVGMNLLAANRIITLQTALNRIPAVLIDEHPWLSYFYGVTLMDTDPPSALPYLKRSRAGFAREKDALGELLAATHLITFHWIVDGKYNQGSLLLQRAEQLLSLLEDELSILSRIQVAHAIAYGYSFFDADIDKADRYSSMALRLAEENDLDNFVAGAAIARGFQHGFKGSWGAFRREIERSYPLLQSPRVTAINKIILQGMQVNLLEMEGDFANYQHQKLRLEQALEKDLVTKSVVGPFLLIWDMDSAIAQGRLDEALEFVKQGLDLGHAGANAHLRSQYLHYLAYLSGIRGETEKALAAAEESLQLRAEAGGRMFVVLNEMILGAAYAQLRLTDQAERHLGKAIKGYEKLDEEFMRAGAYAHRAYLRLEIGEKPAALEDVRLCLGCLKKNDYVHFFSWTPHVMQRVLSVAVQNGIEIDYARKLAAERLGLALLTEGEAIPLLKVQTLGQFALDVDGKTVTAGDLTPTQRGLFALLVAAPGRSLSQEEIQLALWPDSPPLKARSKLDNLLSRLRKVLDEAFKPHSVRHYLALEKGVLRLENCRIDAVGFAKYARSGLEHAKRREIWQAGNAFYSAHRLWKGEFMPGVHLDDTVGNFREDLSHLYLESAHRWSEILAQSGQAEEAIRVAAQAVKHDRTNEPLIKALYNLHAQSGNSIKARQVVKRYEEALVAEDYAPEEIEEILESFWAASS